MKAPDAPASITLENSDLLLRFDLEQAAIAQLIWKEDGTEIIGTQGGEPSPLFAIGWGPPTQQPAPHAPPPRAIGKAATLRVIETAPPSAAPSPSRDAIDVTYEVKSGDHAAWVRLTLRIAPGNAISASAEITNQSTTESINEVVLPVVGGVSLTGSARGETLYYPFFSGVRLRDPRIALARGKDDPHAVSPLQPRYDQYGGGLVRHLYCGQLSMPWMVLAGEGKGIGIIHCDPNLEVTALSVYAPGMTTAEGEEEPDVPGLDLAVSKLRPIAPGERRQLPPTEIVLFSGSWHVVADRYREWMRSRRILPPRVPDWVRESHALTAHYDFKWEDGTYLHTFADIPKLYRRTAQEGVTHLFLAGWFTGGFDHLYPEFFPDLQLGTVMDFIDALRTVRDAGGRTTLYINASLFGRASRFHSTLGQAWAAKDPRGASVDRTFFGRAFTVSCRGEVGYRRLMRDTVRWLVGEVGVSGVYLDTFAAIGPHLCFDPAHAHPHPAHWNKDSVATLRMVEDSVREVNPDAFTMIEGCGDVYGQWVVAHLVHGWAYPRTYSGMFRYTFPDYVLIDMVYPRQGQSFRPERISREAMEQMYRTFINGLIFWMYDQEDDRFCNFRTDPEMWQRLKELIALRERAIRYFGYGRFLDDVGLVYDDAHVDAKRYAAQPATGRFEPDDLEMIVVWNRSGGAAELTLTSKLIHVWGKPVEALRFSGVSTEGDVDVAVRVGQKDGEVQLSVAPRDVVLVMVSASG